MKRREYDKPDEQPRTMKPFRCLCGSMLARLVPGGVELKCRRCKRQVIVSLEEKRVEKFVSEI